MTTQSILLFLGGSILINAAALALGCSAVAFDWLVRRLQRGEASPALCKLLHQVALVVAVIDFSVLILFAAAHAWDARPEVMRTEPPRAEHVSATQSPHL